MISDRQAVSMIEEELAAFDLKHLHTKHLYEFMQAYASKVVELGKQKELRKFEAQLIVADRLYTEGTVELRDIMEKVYVSTLSHLLELQPDLMRIARGHLHEGLLLRMRKDQLSNNP